MFARVAPYLLLGSLASLGCAQNLEHPGLVHLGDGEWGTPDEARAEGLVFYRDRWLPKRLESKLERWEREDRKIATWEEAYRTNSKHYRILSNAPRYVMELEIKPFLDELFRTYVDVFKSSFGLSSRSANKNFIKIYWGYADYHAHEGRTWATPGYFRGDELVVFYDTTNPGNFYKTVFHEGAHQFFAAALPGADLPIWLEESLATYFEGCRFSRATSTVVRGHVPPDRLRSAQHQLREAMRRGGSPSARVMFMRFDTRTEFGALQYGLAWSFLHYLIHRDGGEHTRLFWRFLDEMNGSGAKPIEEVFRHATRSDLAEVEPGWADWVLKLEAPPQPEWVFLRALGRDEGIEKDDLAWSIDGVDVFDSEHFDALWSNRPKDRPFELKVVRREVRSDPMDYLARFVTVTVEPGSELELEVRATANRSFNLVD